MTKIAHLLVMMVDSTSETWYELVDDTSGGRAVIYRSRFHAVLAKISHIYTPATAAWASTVHVRAFAEQDAQAGRHIDGLQGVDRTRAGPRGLAEAHLSNSKVPPRDSARRLVTHA